MFLVGEMAMRPGELPALRGATRGTVSFTPLTITKPPKVKVEVTPCEARTRFVRPLGGPFFALLPQEMKLRLADTPSTRTRTLLFKRRAPNDMKKGDLVAKRWIITDPSPVLIPARGFERACLGLFSALEPHPHSDARREMQGEMRELVLILYSEKLYGG
jgi:hypothetical protein